MKIIKEFDSYENKKKYVDRLFGKEESILEWFREESLKLNNYEEETNPEAKEDKNNWTHKTWTEFIEFYENKIAKRNDFGFMDYVEFQKLIKDFPDKKDYSKWWVFEMNEFNVTVKETLKAKDGQYTRTKMT